MTRAMKEQGEKSYTRKSLSDRQIKHGKNGTVTFHMEYSLST